MPEDDYYLKVPDEVKLILETPPGSNSLQWEQCREEINKTISRIGVKDIKQDGAPVIVISILHEGSYRISPFDCEIDSYELKEGNFLTKIQDEKFDDRAEIKSVGFALPVSIRLDYKQEEGRLYNRALPIKDAHIAYFG